MKKVFSIFAQNLAYYNEGELVGDWLDLPQEPEIIEKYLKEVVKVDDEHEEYEIADVENIQPFPYSSIQWSNVKDLNNLAIIYNSLTEFQKEAVEAYLEYEGEENYDIKELINICLQADKLEYYQYSFDGIEYNEDFSPDLKMGYTMAEGLGIYDSLKKQGLLDFFDFEKYGKSFEYTYELLDKGYYIPNDSIDLKFYTKEEIDEKINKIIEKNSKNKEVEEVEI